MWRFPNSKTGFLEPGYSCVHQYIECYYARFHFLVLVLSSLLKSIIITLCSRKIIHGYGATWSYSFAELLGNCCFSRIDPMTRLSIFLSVLNFAAHVLFNWIDQQIPHICNTEWWTALHAQRHSQSCNPKQRPEKYGTLLIATIIGTLAALAWAIASCVCGLTPSSAATTIIAMSVTRAPRARIAVNAYKQRNQI